MECLEDRSLSFIENIYSENDNNNGWGDIDDKGKDKVMPRRGNRFWYHGEISNYIKYKCYI